MTPTIIIFTVLKQPTNMRCWKVELQVTDGRVELGTLFAGKYNVRFFPLSGITLTEVESEIVGNRMVQIQKSLPKKT